MGKIYQEKYTIPYYQSDSQGNVLVSSLLAVLLQASGVQSTALGRSDEWIIENYGLTWIVTDYAMDIQRLPKFMETVTIETEAVSYNKLFCYRDFRVIAEEGLIVTVHSSWVLMDFASRKVSRVVERVVSPYECEQVKRIERGHKFAALENPETKVYQVRFSDIDRNQHVNNVKYYDWAIDTLDYNFLITYRPHQIFIKYVHELRYGDEVNSHVERVADETHHEINNGAALMEISWIKNPD